MSISDLDIYRSARLLVKRHGDDAVRYAAERADVLARAGDEDGRVVWRRIAAAVEELSRTGPSPDEAMN